MLAIDEAERYLLTQVESRRLHVKHVCVLSVLVEEAEGEMDSISRHKLCTMNI